MFSKIKLFFSTLLPIILYSLFMIQPAYAQMPNANYNMQPIPSTVSPTSPLYTDLLVFNLFHTFSCLATGQSSIGQPCLTYQMQKNVQGTIQGIPMLSQIDLSGGTLGAMGSILDTLYITPPIKTSQYLASIGQGLGIVKEAHAQVLGSGANILDPIILLWQVSRNIAYIIMVIVFVIIGLMVMFRNRINPQTVITAQAALPGLVIGLILITFSYFLAALLTDTAFIGTNLVGYYFAAANPALPPGTAPPPQNMVETIKNESVISIYSRYAGIIEQGNATEMLASIWPRFTDHVQQVLTTLAVFLTANFTTQATQFFQIIPGVGQGIQAAITGLAAGATAANPTGMVGFALAFIATAILLYAMFRLLLRLINNYLSIIFLTISAPFHFLAASLPGRQGIATNWILNMLCNILAFPAVFAVLYFVAYLLGPNNPSGTPFNVTGSTGLTGPNTLPLFGGLGLSFINILLAFGALVALPAIPDIICRTIGRLGVAGQLIGQELSSSVGAGRGYAGQFQQGVGGVSGQAAQGRQLFGRTGWRPTYGEEGELTGYAPSAEAIHGGGPGAIQRGIGWFQSRGTGIKKPT